MSDHCTDLSCTGGGADRNIDAEADAKRRRIKLAALERELAFSEPGCNTATPSASASLRSRNNRKEPFFCEVEMSDLRESWERLVLNINPRKPKNY